MAHSVSYHVRGYAAQAVNYFLEFQPQMSIRRQQLLQDIIENAIAAGVFAERGQPPLRIDAPHAERLADTPREARA